MSIVAMNRSLCTTDFFTVLDDGVPEGVVTSLGVTVANELRDGFPQRSDSKEDDSVQTFAFDGFFSWRLNEESDDSKTISVEEMAVITETGAEYMTPPQEDLILISN